MCSPRVVAHDDLACQEPGVKESSVQAVLQGMLDACAPGGTSFPFFERNGTIYANAGVSSASNAGFNIDAALSRGAIACKTGTAEFGGQDHRGYRNTHGLWVGIVEPRLPLEVVSNEDSNDTNDSDEDNFEVFSKVNDDERELFIRWAQHIDDAKQLGSHYPKRLAILVIVESDETTPFKEGSRDAAPVAAQILNWMEGGSL
jgi:hypothetical protein